jgi:hypothetical protein
MQNMENPCMPAAFAGSSLTMQDKVHGTNISDTTFLATDYLNHFNEVIMMLDMVPTMPSFMDELLDWEPKSYQQHFREAGLRDAALAVEAYRHVPVKYREPFEEIVQLLNRFVETAVRRLSETTAAQDNVTTSVVAKDHSDRLTKLVDLAGAIINGREDVLDRDQIDVLFPDQV